MRSKNYIRENTLTGASLFLGGHSEPFGPYPIVIFWRVEVGVVSEKFFGVYLYRLTTIILQDFVLSDIFDFSFLGVIFNLFLGLGGIQKVLFCFTHVD